MLAQITVGREEQDRAVERPTVALDHADHQVQRRLGSDPGEPIDSRSGDLDRGVEVATEVLSPLAGAVTDDSPERDPTRIPGQKRLREHRKRRTARTRLARKAADLLQPSLEIEAHRGRLHDRRRKGRHGVASSPPRASTVKDAESCAAASKAGAAAVEPTSPSLAKVGRCFPCASASQHGR